MKKPLTVKEFLKNNIILIFILVAIFVVSLIAFITVFWNTLYDVSAWGSLVSGIFTYLGSTFLGLVVFYNTLCQQRQKEIDDQIIVEISHYIKDDNKEPYYYIPFSYDDINKTEYCYGEVYPQQNIKANTPQNINFLYFEVTNRNTHVPIYVKPITIHVLNGEKFVDVGFKSYYSDMRDVDAVDYKQTKKCFIGTNNNLLRDDYFLTDENQLCYVTIKITSVKGQVLLASFEYLMGMNLLTGKLLFETEEEYNEIIEKYGAPIINKNAMYYTMKGQGARVKKSKVIL